MKFEQFLQPHFAEPIALPQKIISSVLWKFTDFQGDRIEKPGPNLWYNIPVLGINAKGSQALYHYLNNDLAVWGRHKKVTQLTDNGEVLKEWIFFTQDQQDVLLKEEPLGVYHPHKDQRIPVWPYGGYYRSGCLTQEIEQIFFTLEYSEGKVCPFFIREMDLREESHAIC